MSTKAPIRLNDEQTAAVMHVGGPMLVRAGAGTGKTAVLVERIARLVSEGHARADEIVATTYTLKAVREIKQRVRERVEEELGPGAADGIRVMNFHQWCHGALQDYDSNFQLLTKEQLYVFLRQQIDAKKLPLKYFQKAANPAKFLGDMMDFMERCHDELVDAAHYRAYVETLREPGATLPRFFRSKEADSVSRDEIIARCEEVADVYEEVERLLAKNNLGSFGQLIIRALELFRTDEKVLAAERKRARFILIDEFQDSNLAQIELADLLTAGEKNIFAVGDPDQAIYRFRGASSAAFQSFMARFPGAKTVTLAQNFRSYDHILACAFGVIKLNGEREASTYARKPLEAARGASDAKVEVVINPGGEVEAYDIAERIQKLIAAGTPPAEIAVLYRQHSHRAEVVRELQARGVPFAISGTDLFRTEAVRDVMACLQALDSATDHVSLFRLALMNRFAIDLDDLRHRLRVTDRGRGVAGALQAMPAGKKLLRELAELQKRFPPHSAETAEIFEATVRLLDLPADSVEIQALRAFIAEWGKLPIISSKLLGPFLRYLDYFQEGGGKLVDETRDDNAVQLTTVHTAKGLEYRHVFVVRVVGQSFPTGYRRKLFEFPEGLRSASAFEAEDDKAAHEEEERRLFYVAVTRARDTLALHGKKGRGKEVLPTGYMREMAKDRSLKDVIEVRDAVFRLDAVAASADTEDSQGSGPPVQGTLFASAPVRNLSASGIETYQSCPLRFKFSKEDGIPDEPGAALQYGNAMHRVLHDFYQAKTAGRPLDELAVIEHFRVVMRESRMEDPLQFELYEEQGVRQLKAFLSGSGRIPVDVVATEENFHIIVEDVPVRGRFDRVDRLEGGKLRVLDYKTGNPKDEKAAEDSMQLAIYAIAAAEKYGQVPDVVAFHNIENDTIIEIAPEPGLLKRAREAVRNAAEGISQGKFDPKPSFACKWCAYSILCPATAEKISTDKPAAAAGGV
ncbi:MAG TPA: ATP-dependent DNA helicase [Terriglobales bacterium]|nr:ATP-dependent DNA helicase [Terriglobales bacterium]